MGKDIKESRQFHLSVEGINCETMYFEHLAKLINESEADYKMKLNCKMMSPISFAKRNSHRPVDKHNKKAIPYIHIQDVEDYYDDKQLAKFKKLIDDMRKAEQDYGITYKLGYSNYTFELWMLLHVRDMKHAVANRYAYLRWINNSFHKNFTVIDEYKSVDNFQEILDEYVTLESIFKAISRAEDIINNNSEEQKSKENYKGVIFYHDNPDLNVHDVVKLIFDVCGVKEQRLHNAS